MQITIVLLISLATVVLAEGAPAAPAPAAPAPAASAPAAADPAAAKVPAPPAPAAPAAPGPAVATGSTTGVPLVSLSMSTVETTTQSALEEMLDASNKLTGQLGALSGGMEGEVPNLLGNPGAGSAPAAEEPAKPAPAPKTAVELEELAQDEETLRTVGSALNMTASSVAPAPAPKAPEAPAKPAPGPAAPADPASEETKKQAEEQKPTQEDDESIEDVSKRVLQPAAAEGSSSGAADESSEDQARQTRIIGASVGGSVAGVVAVCGLALGIAMAVKKYKKNGKCVKSSKKDANSSLDQFTDDDDQDEE